MHIGSNIRSIGRFVVDIDDSLHATDQAYLTARDILALHGRVDQGAQVIWEINGQSIPLRPSDRIEMDENRVDFFRTIAAAASAHGVFSLFHTRRGRRPAFAIAA